MSKNVYNQTLNQEKGGYVWSFQQASSTQGRVNFQQAVDLSPVILGDATNLSGISEITHDAISLKSANSLFCGIPDCLGQFRDVAIIVTNDVHATLGTNNFLKSEIKFIAQRTMVEPQSASRSGSLAQFHTHNKERGNMILTYLASDKLQTEIEDINGNPISAPDGSIIRIGSGISHRSQINTTTTPLIRTFCAFLVYPKHPMQNHPANAAFNSTYAEKNATPIDEALKTVEEVRTFPEYSLERSLKIA